MERDLAIGTLLAALSCAGSAQLSAQDIGFGNQAVLFIPAGEAVYDTVNHVTWLADGNLASAGVPGTLNFRFGLPLCPALTIEPTEPCVNPSGSMNYASAVAWVKGMNDANYLGHHTWQLPTAPSEDSGCSGKGPAPFRESFAFGCKKNALGFLYYAALDLKAPDTAVPIPPNTVGPFSNFQPNLYWSGSGGGGLTCTIANFSFGSGAQGGGCGGDFADVLPSIKGEILGAPIPAGSELHVDEGGQTVYDPETNTTWLADANLAATWLAHTIPPMDTLGLPRCKTAPDTTPCVALDGSMNYESAVQFIKNMNAYDNGAGKRPGYLGQTNWELPSLDASCPTYGCGGDRNPMGNLYYDQLKISAGTPVVAVPDIAVGPFRHLEPFPYWECLADTIQDACETGTNEPGTNSEWGFSFGTGFLGTERVTANHFVTAYYVGCDPDQSWCQTIDFPAITATEHALTSHMLSATASSGLAVKFTSTTPEVCGVSGNTASLKLPGTCTIEASQAGYGSFESALPVQQSFTVDRAKQTVTFAAIETQKQGAVVHLKATASSGLEVAFSASTSLVTGLSTGPAPVCLVMGDVAETLKPGTCSIVASQAGDDLYAPASAGRSFTVTGP
jgi:hypothetical protein